MDDVEFVEFAVAVAVARTVFVGDVHPDSEAVPAEFLANLDLFVSSSISEGLPLSAIQAMVSGVPLVATRVGGYAGLIDDRVNGWLVEPGEPKLLAEGIEQLANDAALRARLAGNARQYATATFDISVMLDKYRTLYAELLD